MPKWIFRSVDVPDPWDEIAKYVEDAGGVIRHDSAIVAQMRKEATRWTLSVDWQFSVKKSRFVILGTVFGRRVLLAAFGKGSEEYQIETIRFVRIGWMLSTGEIGSNH